MSLRPVLFTLALTLISPVALALDLEWEQIYDDEDVKVSRAEVEGSKLFAFRGDTIMAASQQQVLGVLLDNDHRLAWVDRLYQNDVLERTSDFDYVIYQAFDLPALFSSRDYVYHGVVTEDEATGVVTLAMQSIEHADAPETIGVRARLIDSRYMITPLEDGTTRVEVEIVTDPEGMMPAWLVNMVQKDWPMETLNGLRGELSKDYASAHMLPSEAEALVAAEEAEAKAKEEAEAAAAIEAEGVKEVDPEAPAELPETEE